MMNYMTPEEREKKEKFELEQRKKSPYKDFIQLNNDYFKQEDWLINKNILAYRILKFLIHNMDGYNAVMCSYKVMEEYFKKSTDTIRIAIKILRENKYINIAKSGTSNIYYINKELAWKSWGTNYKYAEFGAKIIISESEQEQIKTKTKKNNIVVKSDITK